MTTAPLDVDALLRSLEVRRGGRATLTELFTTAGVASVDDRTLMAAVAARLAADPALVEVWQGYSYDKRSTPSPYLDGLEVGFYDRGYQHVARHPTATAACADFVVREVRWVVEGRVVEADCAPAQVVKKAPCMPWLWWKRQ